MKALRTQNYYDILGVTSSASSEEIRRAYELSKVTFQENSLATYSLFTDEENQEILGLISRAYETLFNPQLRREYDEFLEGLKTEGGYEGARANDFQPKQARQPFQTEIFQPRDPVPSPSFSRDPSQHTSSQRVTVQPARQNRPESLRTEGPGPESLRTEAPGPESLRTEAPGPGSFNLDAPRPEPAPPPSLSDPAEKLQNREALEQYLESVTVFNGPVLKKIRELHGLTLENIAEHTKIRRTYLEYIEEGEFTFLPAEIYVKGFVSLVARMLDLPTERVSTDYMNTYYKKNSQ
ncbi:MAG: helix-turn-helix domain-containing protein [bacterium]